LRNEVNVDNLLNTTLIMNYVVFRRLQMGELFERYFRLLAGSLPGAEYGVIATPDDEPAAFTFATESSRLECLCCRG
jgi:hypothetical protein